MTCIRVVFSQKQNGFPSDFDLSMNLQRVVEYHVVHGLHVVFDSRHRVRRKLTFILDLLLAHLAPTWIDSRVTSVCGPGVNKIARPDRAF